MEGNPWERVWRGRGEETGAGMQEGRKEAQGWGWGGCGGQRWGLGENGRGQQHRVHVCDQNKEALQLCTEWKQLMIMLCLAV